MYVGSDIRVQIADYPFDPRATSNRFVATRKGESQTLYRVFIRLEGPDVNLIRNVTYKFHPSVKPPTLYLSRSDTNPDFMTDLWLWGTFEMNATITDIQERKIDLPSHWLQFDKFFDPQTFKSHGLTTKFIG